MTDYTDIYTDGATLGNNGKLGTVSIVGIGIHIPDKKINIARRLDGGSNNEAEFLALIHACIVAQKAKIKKPFFHLDSQIVVNRANGARPTKIKFYNGRMNMLQDILLGLLQNFQDWKIEWIPREENGIADSLSKQGLFY